MDEKMESEHSYSGDSSSSSDSSTGSSDVEEEVMEPVRILGHTLELPQELCEDYSVFKEFFSMKTWESLEEKNKERLMQYLPKFHDNEKEEKEKTVEMLFNYEPFHFTSPLSDFYNNLKHGNYRPDIAKMRKFLRRARTKQQKHKIKSYYAKLLPEVLICRERLLAAAKAAPPGPAPFLPPLPSKPKSKFKPVYLRVRHRYFEELAAIRSEVGGEESDDDNYPEGPQERKLQKRKSLHPGQSLDSNVAGTLGGTDPHHPTSLECLKNILAAHRARRQYRENHPELNTTGITLEDIKQRVALVNGTKKLMFGGQKSETPIQKLKKTTNKKESVTKHVKPELKSIIKKTKEEDQSVDNKPLLPNIKIKSEQDSDSESSSLVDPVTSPKQTKSKLMDVDIKQEADMYSDNSCLNYDNKLESAVKEEPQDSVMSMHNSSRLTQPVPIKLEDLDGIDMMALPVELADDSGELAVESGEAKEEVVDPEESLTETTHANFLSLVRALFPARAAHRASKRQLHARCAAALQSPIAPLNTWYNLSSNWCAELDSALDFLAGERGPHPDDYVPYLQFIPETGMYQWIGAGRDCDSLLGRLCERWLRAMSPAPPSVPAVALQRTSRVEPTAARYTSSWVVRPATTSEITEFRAQERRRFAAAAKPFTYVQHGYRSVVGPCARGAGGVSWGSGGASGSGGGIGNATGIGAAVLSQDRPRHASFIALVRDAVARLPNGEGTRSNILTMLLMSQWILPLGEHVLSSALSAALDRLQSIKRDPIVKYDSKTSLWTYLHRNRSEEDWMKPTSNRRSYSKSVPVSAATPVPPPSPPGKSPAASVPALAMRACRPRQTHRSPSPDMDMEVGSVEEIVENASDSDVDVDDSGSNASTPHLSSAQLLMAQQSNDTKLQTPKPKKPSNSPPKLKSQGKTSQSRPNLMTQSAKLASLMAQSAKQANILAQAKQLAQSKHSIAQKQSTPQPKQNTVPAKPTNVSVSVSKDTNSVQTNSNHSDILAQLVKNVTKPSNASQKQVNVLKPVPKPITPTPKQSVTTNIPKQALLIKPTSSQSIKQSITAQSIKPTVIQTVTQIPKSSPSILTNSQKSPLIKQRLPQKEIAPTQTTAQSINAGSVLTSTVVHPTTLSVLQNSNKLVQGTRSLLIRPPPTQTTVTAPVATPTAQTLANARRSVVRVLSPATPSPGKSLISPRALLQQTTPTTKKRPTITNLPSVTTVAQSTSNVTTVVSSVPTVVTSSVTTRTVQLGGRTVQLAANQTVHLPRGQAVQISPGHTLQLSSLQLPTHSVRLPSGQTVQLATSQTMQAVRAVSTAAVKNTSPRTQQSSPTVKTPTTPSTLQIPVSTVQLAGQTVQIAGQSVQLAGQSVQLTGHTVKLPSGQSVQVASQSVLPTQSVQLPSGQTVQIAGNLQTVQLGAQSLQLSGQSVQMPSGQSVQLGGQTVQLAGSQTVQLPSGQTLQLSSGQTVQLSNGQTLQLASGQTVQLANQQAPKTITQIVRNQTPGEKSTQPLVAKLLTNAQGQTHMVSLESVGGAGVRARGMRVLPARPLLLTAHKPLHNVILQQSDGSTIRVTSSTGVAPTQTIVLSNIGAQGQATTSSTPPVLKLQQAVSTSTVTPSGTVNTVRSVLMDGQQLKLVGGRHVLARILRPAHPPQ